MLDILQLRVKPEELEQLHSCQLQQRADGFAAFTVKGSGTVWPFASWGEPPAGEKMNVRGWFPLLDQIADEFLIWWPKGGCFFVGKDAVTHRLRPEDGSGVLFLELELNRLKVMTAQTKAVRAPEPLPRLISRWG